MDHVQYCYLELSPLNPPSLFESDAYEVQHPRAFFHELMGICMQSAAALTRYVNGNCPVPHRCEVAKGTELKPVVRSESMAVKKKDLKLWLHRCRLGLTIEHFLTLNTKRRLRMFIHKTTATLVY